MNYELTTWRKLRLCEERINLIVFTSFLLLLTSVLHAQDNDFVGNPLEPKPEIHGTIRGKYEYQPEMDAGRFQVRNARFSISGHVHPIVGYKAEIDLSDEGAIRMLDAFISIQATNSLNFTIGQMRVPFTIDAHRSPHLQHFANRSFIAKQVGNLRDVGAIISYKANPLFPLQLEAGVFNGSGLTQQKVWHQSMSYSGKAQLMFIKGMNLTLSAQSIEPESVRMNLLDVGLNYRFMNFHFEAEYIHKHYKDRAFDDVQAFNSFVNYDVKLKKHFDKISFLVRYDRMTDNNDGYADTVTNTLNITDHQRQRITGGITLSIDKPFIADIRINYENYFYKKSGIPKESEKDKFVIELMTRF